MFEVMYEYLCNCLVPEYYRIQYNINTIGGQLSKSKHERKTNRRAGAHFTVLSTRLEQYKNVQYNRKIGGQPERRVSALCTSKGRKEGRV